ncbi:hypothetical protein [Cupriavidus oxalaticus]|uniref:hypothetical protein n=1 Tax=Cupriavidus oxalaticus TaxID=96344 RepID=UPI003F73CF3F
MTKSENEFREAFFRLINGATQIVPPGTPISQNNVAREAGRDPSALKKSRHPRLVNDIQQWIRSNSPEKSTPSHKNTVTQRQKTRTLRQQISDLMLQRDHAFSLLVEADAIILELTAENMRLKGLTTHPTSTVLEISSGRKKI